jgi:hypothetical protein
VFDDLASSGGPVEFDSLLHALGSSSIKVKNDLIQITQQEVTLSVKVLNPTAFISSIKRGQPEMIQNSEYPTSYIMVHPQTKLAATQFLMVLYPLGKGETLPPISGISAPDISGAQVVRGKRTDMILFNPKKTRFTAAGVSSDATSCYLSVQGDTVMEFAVHGGTTLSYKGKTVFSSSRPSTVAIQYRGSQISGRITSDAPVDVSLGSQKSASLSIDGGTRRSVSTSRQGVISFSLEKGEHSLELTTTG